MNGDSEKWDLNTLLIQSVERDIKTQTIPIPFTYSILLLSSTIQYESTQKKCEYRIKWHFNSQNSFLPVLYPFTHITNNN